MRTIKVICSWLLVAANAAIGDVIISSGPGSGYVAPNPPYEPDELILEVTIGYGDPSNTIGAGLWHTGPGVYDLSGDPGWAGFLVNATDGLVDVLTVTVTDTEGYQDVYCWNDWEAFLFGQDPYTHVDLYPLEVTGVLFEVIGVYPAGLGGIDYDIIEVRYDFLGVPEPAGILVLIAGWSLLDLCATRRTSRT